MYSGRVNMGKSNIQSKEQRHRYKNIRKKLLFLYLFIGALLVLIVSLRKALDNKEYGTANYVMDKMADKNSTLYNEADDKSINYTAADMYNDNVKLDFSEKDINKNGDIGEIILEIMKLFEQRDYTTLYERIDLNYLNNKGYYLYIDTFEQYQESVVNDLEYYSLELKGCIAEPNNTYSISGTYLELITLPNGERGYRETEQEFHFTIILKDDGSYSFLPFKESSLFIESDFGVTRLNFN